MSSLLETLMSQLGGDGLKQLSTHVGSDEKSTSNAMATALPVLLGALSRNSAKPEGATALHSALEKEHDGGIMDNLSGFLGGAKEGPGDGILGHVLGGRRPQVERAVSKTSGMDSGSTAKLLTAIAPMILGALGKTQKKEGLSANGLAGFLNSEQKSVEAQAPQQTSLIGKLLDTDNDGDFDLGDMAKHGAGLLGSFFKKR